MFELDIYLSTINRLSVLDIHQIDFTYRIDTHHVDLSYAVGIGFGIRLIEFAREKV